MTRSREARSVTSSREIWLATANMLTDERDLGALHGWRGIDRLASMIDAHR
jgi:hypothetical protein